MDFNELENKSHVENMKKNRMTLVALFAMFILPVLIAYAAYFSGWFSGATINRGELLVGQDVLDIEDFKLTRSSGEVISGEEFETLYWWVIPIDPMRCDEACLKLNLYTVNQTYLGLGKEAKRLKLLLVLPENSQVDADEFPVAYSPFSNTGVKALAKTKSGLNKDLPANFIYLVDPLGNIILRYPLADDKSHAVDKSKDLRTDILRLFKYSRLG